MTLLLSFDSVKAEFSDLDGLSWSNVLSIGLASTPPYITQLWFINFPFIFQCGSNSLPEDPSPGDMTGPAIKENRRDSEATKTNMGHVCLAQNQARAANPGSSLGRDHVQNPNYKPPIDCQGEILSTPTGTPAPTGMVISESLKYTPDGYLSLPPSSSNPFPSASSTGYTGGPDHFRYAPTVAKSRHSLADFASLLDPVLSDPCSPKRMPKDVGLGIGDLNVKQEPHIGTFQSFDRDIDIIFGSITTNNATPTPFSSPSMSKASPTLSPLACYSPPRNSNFLFVQDETRNSEVHALHSPLYPIKRQISPYLRRTALEMSGLPYSSSENVGLVDPDIRGLSHSKYLRWYIPSQPLAPAAHGSQFVDRWKGHQKAIDSPTWSTLAQCPGTPYANSQIHSTTFNITESPQTTDSSKSLFVCSKSFTESFPIGRGNMVV